MMLVLRTALFTILISSVVESKTGHKKKEPCGDYYCAHGGTCVAIDGAKKNRPTPTCQCAGSWQGDRCDDNPCAGINCNSGTCRSNENGSSSCCCPEGCKGETCSDDDNSSCEAANGECVADDGTCAADLILDIPCCNGKVCCRAPSTAVACEGSTLTLSCDDGDYLVITAANYGRENYKTCPHTNILTDQCYSSASLSVVQKECGGKQTCSLEASSDTFGGDPCLGTYKYLKVSYYCAAATEIVVCEGSTLSLSCDDGGVLAITAANYGRDDYEICPHPSILTDRCFSSGSLSAVQTACEGKQSCSLAVNSATFGGDPCRGTYKYLKVSYFCAA